jgi:hypothetical protein
MDDERNKRVYDNEGNKGNEGNEGNEGNKGNKAGGDGTSSSEKNFSQEQVNNLVARETKKAKESFLKDAGFDDFDNLKDGLKQYKEWKDSTKSDIQKLTDDNANYKKQINNLDKELKDYKSERKLLNNGVKLEYITDFNALTKVSGIDDIDNAIKAVSVKHPYMLKDEESKDKNVENKNKNSKVNFGVRTKGNSSSFDERLIAFKKRAGVNKV